MPKKKKPADELLMKLKNPYIKDFEIRVRVAKRKKDFRETATGNKPLFSEHEHGERVQLYVSSETRIRKSKLSRIGKEMLLYIQDQIQYGHEHIWINRAEYKKEMEVKESTYKSSVKELVDKGFLARTEYEDVFIFDPKIMWKGDRAGHFEKVDGVVLRFGDVEELVKAYPNRNFAKQKAAHTELDTQDGNASNRIGESRSGFSVSTGEDYPDENKLPWEN